MKIPGLSTLGPVRESVGRASSRPTNWREGWNFWRLMVRRWHRETRLVMGSGARFFRQQDSAISGSLRGPMDRAVPLAHGTAAILGLVSGADVRNDSFCGRTGVDRPAAHAGNPAPREDEKF